VTIKLDEGVDLDGEGEEEIDTTEPEEEEDCEDDMEEAEDIDGYPEFGSHSDEDDSSSWYDPDSPVAVPRSRKRSCDELDESVEDKGHVLPGRGGTPPKRARTDSNPGRKLAQIAEAQMQMYRKRSSQVLEERGGRGEEISNKGSKRAKMASSDTSAGDENTPDSPPPTSDCSLPSSASTEDMERITVRRISQADLEQLYVLGDE
jgi:hypothetical protein